MSLWKIAWRSIEQRALASSLTAFSMALGVALVVAVLVIHGLIEKSFMTGSGLGYNMIVGADKGGKLQLVLNTVYYLSSPVENIPYSFYKEFTEGKYKDYVAKAIPVCLGDYYENYRVVGTTPAFFEELTYNDGEKFRFAEGGNFKQDEFFTGVIGATVARELKMKVGSKFTPTHSVDADDHTHDPFRVVGTLEPTGTPNDRALFINMEGFYLTGDHAKPVEKASQPEEEQHDEHADEHKHEHDHDHADEHKHGDHDHGDRETGDAEHDHDEEHEAAGSSERPAEEPSADAPQKMSDKEAGEESSESAPTAKKDAHEDEHDHAHEHEEHDHEHAHEDDHAHGPDEHDHEHDHDHEHGHSHDHDHHHHEPIPEEQREVTAVLLLTAGNPPELFAAPLMNMINEGVEGQAVMPIREITMMFQIFVAPVKWLLLGLTVLIVLVAGIGILVSIYNSMSERKHDIAVMRALGAGRGTVMLIVLLESILLALAGGLIGWMLGHLLIWGLNPWLVANTGVGIGLFQFVPLELVIIPGLIVLAAIVGYLPALVAYRTDVAKALSASP